MLGKERMPADRVYDVTGSLCENNDKFAIQRPLPEMVPGDGPSVLTVKLVWPAPEFAEVTGRVLSLATARIV